MRSKSAGNNPVTFAPLAAGGHALQLVINARVCEIERIGDRRHRFEADEVAPAGRVDHGNGVLGAIQDRDLFVPALDGEMGAAVCAAL